MTDDDNNLDVHDDGLSYLNGIQRNLFGDEHLNGIQRNLFGDDEHDGVDESSTSSANQNDVEGDDDDDELTIGNAWFMWMSQVLVTTTSTVENDESDDDEFYNEYSLAANRLDDLPLPLPAQRLPTIDEEDSSTSSLSSDN